MVVGPLPFRGVLHMVAAATRRPALLMVGGIVLAGERPLVARRSCARASAAVHEGRERGSAGRIPAEVQPLVNDLNALLDHRDRRVQEALAKAGDLAHGLKTPLAVLAHEADRAAAAGHRELARGAAAADRSHAAADRLSPRTRPRGCFRRHGRRARARCAPRRKAWPARSSGCTPNAASASSSTSPTTHAVRGQREDLDEMLGNLLDNACKWARSRVSVSSSNGDAGRRRLPSTMTVPGCDVTLRQAVLQRGVRADEAAPGSGLGLAIVRELAELYGGSIALDASPLGGLRARLRLPAAG